MSIGQSMQFSISYDMRVWGPPPKTHNFDQPTVHHPMQGHFLRLVDKATDQEIETPTYNAWAVNWSTHCPAVPREVLRYIEIPTHYSIQFNFI